MTRDMKSACVHLCTTCSHAPPGFHGNHSLPLLLPGVISCLVLVMLSCTGYKKSSLFNAQNTRACRHTHPHTHIQIHLYACTTTPGNYLIKENMRHIRIRQEHVWVRENGRAKWGKGIWFDIFLSTSAQQGLTFTHRPVSCLQKGPVSPHSQQHSSILYWKYTAQTDHSLVRNKSGYVLNCSK